MEQQQRETSYTRIRIRMERPFHQFGYLEQEEFLKDLSYIAGFPRSEFRAIEFRAGCVIFEGDISREATARLLELLEKRKEENSSSEIEEFNKFLRKHGIAQITDDLTISISIRTSKKTPEKQIVFVHGWLGDKESFGQLPTLLAQKLACDTFVYEYPSGVWVESPSLQFISRDFDNWVRNHINATKIAIVAHSMGGLVTRKFLVSQYWRDKPLDGKVKQVTFVASPHNGAVLAQLVRKVPFLRKAQLTELSSDSSFLVDLNNQWVHWTRNHVPSLCQVRCIYGTSDDVVAPNDALGLDPEAIPILNAGHIDIVKPHNETSPLVLTIERFLRESDFGAVNSAYSKTG